MLNITLLSVQWAEVWAGIEAASAALTPWSVVALGLALVGGSLAIPAKPRITAFAQTGTAVARSIPAPYSARALRKGRERVRKGTQRPLGWIISFL